MSKSKTSKKSRQSKKKVTTSKNKIWLWIIAALVGFSLILMGILIYPSLSQPNETLPPEISVDEAYDRYEEGAFLLDVRQYEEWVEYHVPGSTLIPLNELQTRLDEVPHDQEVIVVCRSGNRSQEGNNILREAGYKNATSMAGGLKAWKASNYPTISGP